MGVSLAGPRMTGVGLRPREYSGTVPVHVGTLGSVDYSLWRGLRGRTAFMDYGIPLPFG